MHMESLLYFVASGGHSLPLRVAHPLTVMMPLTTVNNDGTLNNASGLSLWMQQAHAGGVNGCVNAAAPPASLRHDDRLLMS